MKQIKKILSVLTALVLCLAPLFGNAMTVHAEGTPTTFYVKYVDALGQWKFQTGGWDDTAHPRDTYYMHEEIKNGDLLVIDGGATTQATINLEVKVNLSNLTVTYSDGAVITATGVDSFYGINDSISVVNAPVKNAYVYDYALVQINNNVNNLEIISSKGDYLHATAAVTGTTDHVKAYSPNYTHFELYNFTAGSLSVVEGALKTAETAYSKTPVATNTIPAAPATSTPATPDTSSGEYDDVPKTADNCFNPLWLVAMAALCFTGSILLRKEN